MRALVSGFEPFGDESVNPSARVVERLMARGVPGVVLPVAFAEAWAPLEAAIAEHEPDVVVALGQAGGATGVVVEQIAVNLDDSSSADEAGARRVEEPIVPDAPLAYRSGLPVAALVAALRDRGIPAQRSRSAGGFVCNHVFYRLCHLVAVERTTLTAGFVHLPYLPEQVVDRREPALPLDVQVAAVETVLETVCAPD